MAGFNLVVQVGNLTRDPELRFTSNGKAVCNFTIAVNTGYGDKESVFYADCVAWGKTAEAVANYCKKGKPVLVSGSLQTRSWDSDGQKKYKTEVIANAVQFLGGKGEVQPAPDEISDIEPF